MGIITGVGNKYVKLLRQLMKAKPDDSRFLVEGIKQVGEITPDWKIESFALSESYSRQNDFSVYSERAEVCVLSDWIFESISGTVSPQGVMAVCLKKEPEEIDFSVPGGLYLVCDRVSDPGNMGTIIRNAHAFGCDALIISENSVNVYNPKIIRATAGSIFKIKFQQGVDTEILLKSFKRLGVKITAAHPAADKLINEVDLTQKCAIVIGNEALGISDFVKDISDELMKIPMPGNSESLNASVACGIVLYEAVRQAKSKQ